MRGVEWGKIVYLRWYEGSQIWIIITWIQWEKEKCWYSCEALCHSENPLSLWAFVFHWGSGSPPSPPSKCSFFFYINRVIFHEGKEGRGRRVMINLMILNLNKCPRVGEGPILLWGEGRREVRGASMFALVLFVLTVSNLLYLHLSSSLVARAASCR